MHRAGVDAVITNDPRILDSAPAGALATLRP